MGPGSYTLAQQDMSVRLAIRPGKESSMFGRTRTDRFGVPVDRDPTAKDTAPGPGTYTLPGALHDAQTAVSAFASATVRGEGGAHRVAEAPRALLLQAPSAGQEVLPPQPQAHVGVAAPSGLSGRRGNKGGKKTKKKKIETGEVTPQIDTDLK